MARGKRGPAATPTEILRKRGSWRAEARRDEIVPPRVTKLPPAPAILRGPGGKLWRRLTKLLDSMDLLFETDLELLTVYCSEWSLYCEAMDEVRARGVTIDFFEADREQPVIGEDGQPRYREVLRRTARNPAIAVAHRSAEILRGLAQEFGLSPAARVGLHLTLEPEPGAGDSAAGLFTA